MWKAFKRLTTDEGNTEQATTTGGAAATNDGGSTPHAVGVGASTISTPSTPPATAFLPFPTSATSSSVQQQPTQQPVASTSSGESGGGGPGIGGMGIGGASSFLQVLTRGTSTSMMTSQRSVLQPSQQQQGLLDTSGVLMGGTNTIINSNTMTNRIDSTRIDRIVTAAAKGLGEGVQRIVLAAKNKSTTTTTSSSESSGGSTSDNNNWRDDLLILLGGITPSTSTTTSSTTTTMTPTSAATTTTKTDIDILLEHKTYENFVARCIEFDLPPNLIHCLRLLRVLELQYATEQQQQQVDLAQEDKQDGEQQQPLTPRGLRATNKVSRLLCTLAKSGGIKVGEQLRPHLFGLLALSGASYPLSGIHVAQAASDVIITFAEFCLHRQLVWFIHDRKMVFHMTDDVKDLAGQFKTATTTASSTTTVVPSTPAVPPNHIPPMSLVGVEAEKAGLWVIALKTVVKLVAFSCQHHTIELVNDFKEAGGLKVLMYAIHHASTRHHGKELMELFTPLICCPNEMTMMILIDSGSTEYSDEDELLKVATDVEILDLLDELLMENNPLLRTYRKQNKNMTPTLMSSSANSGSSSILLDNHSSFNKDSNKDANKKTKAGLLSELATLSIHTAMMSRQSLSAIHDQQQNQQHSYRQYGFDMNSELLSVALQLFSNHARNYEIVEGKLHILAYYVLAFPCYADMDLKNFILKTLEFVLTGVGVGEEVIPVHACIEIFFALCRTSLRDVDTLLASSNITSSSSSSDLSTGGTGIPMTSEDVVHIVDLLCADTDLMGSTLEKLLQFDQRVAPLMVESGILTTNLDALLSIVRGRLSALKEQEKMKSNDHDGSSLHVSTPPEETPLDKIFCIVCRVLKLLVAHQPVNFSRESSSSSEVTSTLITTASSSATSAAKDSTNLHLLLRTSINDLGNEPSVAAAGVFEAYMSSFASMMGLKNDMRFVLNLLIDLASLVPNVKADHVRFRILTRQSVLLSLIRSVLEARSLARDAFRECGGFQTMLSLLVAWKDSVDPSPTVIVATSVSVDDTVPGALSKLFQWIVSVLESAVGLKSRAPMGIAETSPLLIPVDLEVDHVSSQLSTTSPATVNRNYLRQRAYYLDLAAAVACTRILTTKEVGSIFDTALGHMDPQMAPFDLSKDVTSIRNPDAARLVYGLCLFMPETDDALAFSLDVLGFVRDLCSEEKIATTLPHLAGCGIVASLCNPREFGLLLNNSSHRLHSISVDILELLAGYSISYADFIGLLRFMCSPWLASNFDGRLRLPVISSALRSQVLSTVGNAWVEGRENECLWRLEALANIARCSDGAAWCRLGGDSINTLSTLLHSVPPDQRLRTMAETGKLRFFEVEVLDASSLTTETPSILQDSPLQALTEKVWTPVTTSGFSYSLWLRHELASDVTGNIFLLDISSPQSASASASPIFLSVWYDLQNKRFNVMTSASYRGEPTCFPVSPLVPHIWHHVLLTYSPSKRSMMSRKSVVCMYVDGRPLEAEVKVDAVNIPPNSRVTIGAPSLAVAESGVVRGIIASWEFGSTILLSTVLLELDATAIYAYGPTSPSLLWGDRPQRTSLAATATATFSMLARTGELGSIASALRRRDLPRLERAGYCNLGYTDRDDLSLMNLLCTIPPECVIFGFQAASTNYRMRNDPLRVERKLCSEKLVNLARLSFSNPNVSADAMVHGKASVVAPISFADAIQWAGGPAVLVPLVNAVNSPDTLALVFDIIREGCRSHRPNLEMLQAGGGYRVLSVLLEKKMCNENVMDSCMAFAIDAVESGHSFLVDVDAMKHLLMNHKVWGLRKYGPDVILRLLRVLNRSVEHRAVHKAFNARRLHQVGIVRWTLHLMIEASELYSEGETNSQSSKQRQEEIGISGAWFSESPLVTEVSVGGDPGNPFLLECKNLLRRVLTFMLTPRDLEALSQVAIYTMTIARSSKEVLDSASEEFVVDDRMHPGSTMRLHLVRLLEELIVDGVNELVATWAGPSSKDNTQRDTGVLPHAGGVASPGQPYFSTSSRRGKLADGSIHPKHNQAQEFLSAFAKYLTPVWFATLLEGSREEASASAIVRLLILMVQGSLTFEGAFQNSGAFSPFVVSVPKYSTSPGIMISMLSHLLSVPILHIHSMPSLDPEQLCELFDAESGDADALPLPIPTDPSSGVFALIAECVGRNIQVIAGAGELAAKTAETNQAIFALLADRYDKSKSFRDFCATKGFLEPLSQALCLVYQEHFGSTPRSKRASFLGHVPQDMSPTERFIGGAGDPDSGGMGLVRFLRRIIHHSISSGPLAVLTVRDIFLSFPIHATPQQVEAYHLIAVEHCRDVVNELLVDGDAVVLANCVGVCSVLLDHLINGFFSSEAALETTKLLIVILNFLIEAESPGVKALGNVEHSMLTMDAAHFANLAVAGALAVSLVGVHPRDSLFHGDEDLQSEILQLVDTNMDSLLLIPSRDRKTPRKIPTGKFPRPSQGSKMFPLLQSASIARCVSAQNRQSMYPDLSTLEDPQTVVTAPLLVSLHRLLLGTRDDIRSYSISILVSLLQHRSKAMSELLVVEVQSETIDVVNRGGFRALLTAHEAASVSDQSSPSVSVKRKYASFFDWFDKHQSQVQQVFDSVNARACIDSRILLSVVDAVEHQQKQMLMRLASEGHDRTILGGLHRADLARRCTETTAELHSQWRRQGFDDLAYGATKLKEIMRRQKGSFSIWEGGPRLVEKAFTLKDRVKALEQEGSSSADREDTFELVKRWKLDLTECAERQRRRLVPNYEFHSLYNLDEGSEHEIPSDPSLDATSPSSNGQARSDIVDVEATAELLKDLNIKRLHKSETDDSEFEFEGTEDTATVATTGTAVSSNEAVSVAAGDDRYVDAGPGESVMTSIAASDVSDAAAHDSSYELVTGLLQKGDWPQKSFNVRRCTGLEVTKSLFLFCRDAVYVIDGFELAGSDKIIRLEKEHSTFRITLRSKLKEKADKDDEDDKNRLSSRTEEVIHGHRSLRIPFSELHAVFRRRYQLQQCALEFYDIHGTATLIAFDTSVHREDVLHKVLQSKLHPDSIFSSYGALSYSRFISNYKQKVINAWVNRKMSNFEFLMEMNNLGGRTFNDLTQYPVFPWVIADYESEELDLNNPKTYRDLSKPMGALGEERAEHFRERYEALASAYFGEDDPPPFHYGTHYSSAAYVLYYLMRLEPFSRLALALQGGKFDVADRLFHDIGRSWRSASSENLQDVRELVPEFFYLHDFLVNTNSFDFGETQKGKPVHDVTLPKWAKGDPKRFVRINRQALESEYVSRHLHLWVDLIFGYKQRSVEDLNVFVHVTYEGEVDLESMIDPIQRASTIAQIQNFGQTPSKIEKVPFPPRIMADPLKDKSIDFGVLQYLAPMTPPFCVVGAQHRVELKTTISDSSKLGLAGQTERCVGDILFLKGQPIGVGRLCSMIVPAKKYCRFGGLNNGLSIHAAAVSSRYREVNKLIKIYDSLHSSPISVTKASLNADWIITGCVDSTIRVWRYENENLELRATLCGHDGYRIRCIDVSTECSLIVSGSDQGRVLLWDLRTLTCLRRLNHDTEGEVAISVSINHVNGNIITIVGLQLTLFDVNGNKLASQKLPPSNPPTCVAATNCPEWMEDGVVAVTGHLSGEVCLWGLNYDEGSLVVRYQLNGSPHTSAITALVVTGIDRQDCLLVGDSTGKISLSKTVQLDSYSREQLLRVVAEHESRLEEHELTHSQYTNL